MGNAVTLHGPRGEQAARQAECAYIQHEFKVNTTIPFQQRREDLGLGQKKYDVITFTKEDGKTRSLWFDVTECSVD